MAVAYKCDRCGCYYSDNDTGRLYLGRPSDVHPGTENIDLCPTCQKMLDNWFKHVDEIQLYTKVGSGRIE